VVGVNSYFIAPADGVAAILAGKGVEPILGAADLLYRKGLSHFFSGRYTDAISDFDQTMAMSPGYPGAQDLKTSAVNLRQQGWRCIVAQRRSSIVVHRYRYSGGQPGRGPHPDSAQDASAAPPYSRGARADSRVGWPACLGWQWASDYTR
jgi:hypothetical protein